MSYVLPQAGIRVGLPKRALIRAAVHAADYLQKRDPASLRQLLERIASEARPATFEETERVKDEVLSASPECRGSDACLTRSITIALLCRLRGRWPSWCVGVLMTPPFTAHAWVEAEARVVEDVLRVGDYRTFYTVRAGRTRAAASTTDASD